MIQTQTVGIVQHSIDQTLTAPVIDRTFMIMFIIGITFSVIGYFVGYYTKRVESKLFWDKHKVIVGRLDDAIFQRRSRAAIKGHETQRARRRK